MNNRSAVKMLAAGERIRHVDWDPGKYLLWSDTDGAIVNQDGCPGYLYPGNDWELASKPPATDEELIAEMERLSRAYNDAPRQAVAAYCAKLLKERKVLR